MGDLMGVGVSHRSEASGRGPDGEGSQRREVSLRSYERVGIDSRIGD